MLGHLAHMKIIFCEYKLHDEIESAARMVVLWYHELGHCLAAWLVLRKWESHVCTISWDEHTLVLAC